MKKWMMMISLVFISWTNSDVKASQLDDCLSDKQIEIYYNQADTKWGKRSYGRSTLRKSGCVPTVLAMIFSNVTDKEVLPTDVANYLYHETDTFNKTFLGTSTEGIFAAVRKWGLEAINLKDKAGVIESLQKGFPVMVAVEKNKFTPYGGSHELLLDAYQNGQVYVYDPYTKANIGWYSLDDLWREQSQDPIDRMGVTTTFLQISFPTFSPLENKI